MSDEETTLDGVLAAERDEEFSAAVRAVVTADTSELRVLVSARPNLAKARSSAVHRSTLLHYVAANGVESPLQMSPGTIYQFLSRCSRVERSAAVERAMNVPKILLEAGAEADAVCGTYGGGPQQTTLNLLVSSAHPFAAGVQDTLAQVLVSSGAAVDGIQDDQSPLLTALAFGYDQTVAALVAAGARTDGLIAAAAAGSVEQVASYFPDGELVAEVGSTAIDWFRMATEPETVAEQALVYSSMCGHTEVVSFLLDRGVNVDAVPPGSHVTAGALHTAALSKQRDVVRLLLDRGAATDVTEPRYGGDPSSWAEHGGDSEIVRMLAEARGA